MTVGAIPKQDVEQWLEIAKDKRFNKAYTDLTSISQMKEMLTYLQEHDFKTYIVSREGVGLCSACGSRSLCVDPARADQLGKALKYNYSYNDGKADENKDSSILTIDDKAERSLQHSAYYQKKPILAVGNPDGDHDDAMGNEPT
ncbi:hypothetical protein O9929_12835 [Vibrio lentus]|nr:hypothetical protein [Vibrio lentus]